MKVQKGFKFRIYPTKEQEILIIKTLGCSRFVFNHFLAKWEETYKTTGAGLSYSLCSEELPSMKDELKWLKEIDSTALQSSLKHLANAYDRFVKKKITPLVLNRSETHFSPTRQTFKAVHKTLIYQSMGTN